MNRGACGGGPLGQSLNAPLSSALALGAVASHPAPAAAPAKPSAASRFLASRKGGGRGSGLKASLLPGGDESLEPLPSLQPLTPMAASGPMATPALGAPGGSASVYLPPTVPIAPALAPAAVEEEWDDVDQPLQISSIAPLQPSLGGTKRSL